jgi:hypothetical protein
MHEPQLMSLLQRGSFPAASSGRAVDGSMGWFVLATLTALGLIALVAQ